MALCPRTCHGHKSAKSIGTKDALRYSQASQRRLRGAVFNLLWQLTALNAAGSGMLVIPTCQHATLDLVQRGEKVETEKDRLLERVRVCMNP
jgi:hypothetical protein